MRFGVVGTNWITDRFLGAARLIEDFQLTAVYSRTGERGREFAQKYGAEAVLPISEKWLRAMLLMRYISQVPTLYIKIRQLHS